MRRMMMQAAGLLMLLSGAAHGEDRVPLKLSDAIKTAVERNLDLRAELYNPAMQEAEYRKSRGIYDPTLGLAASMGETTTYSLLRSTSKLWSRSVQLDAGISQLLPTGATVSLDYENSYVSSDQASASAGLSSYWNSILGLTLSQPLLKNFGSEATELTIEVARLGKDATLEKLQSRLMALVAQVRTEYFKLYSLQREREVAKVSLELARRILSETQARVNAGVLPAMEILNAQYGVASREKELIDAERAVTDQSDLVRQLVQLEAHGVLEAVDQPLTGRYEAYEQEEMGRALNNRPELKELQRNRDAAELQARVADNRSRPDLNLTASAATAGLGESYGRDMDRLGSGNYPAWGVGLTFSYPLGNRAAENDYRKSRLKSDQLSVQIRNQQELIVNEVRAALRAIEANFKLLDVAERGRRFAEERLNAFVRKAEVGLATTKDVLDVEHDLATAKQTQIQAQVSYDSAVTQLWKATGVILERQQVRMVAPDADRLYRDVR